MINIGIHICPEPIFIAGQFFPETDRAFIGKGEFNDRFNPLKPIFPRQYTAQRGAILLLQPLAIHAGADKGQLIHRLFDSHPFNIGPGIPALALTRGNRRVVKGFHTDEFCFRLWLGNPHQFGHTDTCPGHRHCPGLYTAMPIEPLFLAAHLFNQISRIQHHLFFDQPVYGDHPRICHQLLCLAPDILGRAKFIKIGIGGCLRFHGQRPIQLIGLILRRRKAGDRRGHRRGKRQLAGSKPCPRNPHFCQ